MRPILTSAVVAALLGGLPAATRAAERETRAFGQAAPSAREIQEFLFPEECGNAAYVCLGVRPSVERSIGVDVKFHSDSADLTPEARSQLEGLGKVLAARGKKLIPGEIVIEGHTDARGTAEYNQNLSERRAQSVASYLVSTFGVDATALKTIGYGKSRLKEADRPDSEANRRVELVRRPN